MINRLHARLKRLYPMNQVCRLIDEHFAGIHGLEQRILDIDPRINALEQQISGIHADDIAANGSALLQGMACLLNQVQQLRKRHDELGQEHERDHVLNRKMASAIDSLNTSLLEAAQGTERSVQLTVRTERAATVLPTLTGLLEERIAAVEKRDDHQGLNNHQDLSESRTMQELARLGDQLVDVAASLREVDRRYSSQMHEIYNHQSLAENRILQEVERLREELVAIAGFLREIDHRDSVHTQQDVERLTAISSATADQVPMAAESGPFIRAMRPNSIVVKTAHFEPANPEIGLLMHLARMLRNRIAFDIGANVGAISGRLLASGYEVFAFEPFPPAFTRLQGSFGKDERFHSHQLAIGYRDGAMRLHIAEDRSPTLKYGDVTLYNSLLPHSMPRELQFNGTIDVWLRSLDSLVRANVVPSDVGVIKIATEGYDLEVLRGMASCSCEVLMARFWDPEMVFAKSGTMNLLSDIVGEARSRGYRWHIVVYRLNDQPISYYCNQPQSVPGSWGNVLFFLDKHTFDEALQWCSTVMAPTYFGSEAPSVDVLQARAVRA